MYALAAFFLLHLPDADPPVLEGLPLTLTLDEAQQPEELPQRPSDSAGAQLFRPDNDAWTVSIAPMVRLVGGKTRVREKASRPIWLDLHERDMGFGVTPGVHLGVGYRLRTIALFAELDGSRADGRGQFSRDFSYDEGRFTGGIPYRTHADLYFGRLGVELPGAIWERRDVRISPFLALEYPRMSVGINQSATHDSSSEQYKQFVPYPIVGVAAEFQLTSTLKLSGRVYAGGVPEIPTPFQEGGRMYTKVLTACANVELSWQVSGSIRLFTGAGYQFWNGRLHSNEDGNNLRLESPFFLFGVEIGF